MTVCRLCRVSGRVQGVFFRASTRQQARKFNLTGHAINLHDGNVEVLACGKSVDVDALVDWLWQGPAHASVTDVKCKETAAQPPNDFTIG
ncbi:MAG: acylphosphatase [Proteobacteria bacterium]|nr:acylphosphatase [Pseudomonadota bacterium]